MITDEQLLNSTVMSVNHLDTIYLTFICEDVTVQFAHMPVFMFGRGA